MRLLFVIMTSGELGRCVALRRAVARGEEESCEEERCNASMIAIRHDGLRRIRSLR